MLKGCSWAVAAAAAAAATRRNTAARAVQQCAKLCTGKVVAAGKRQVAMREAKFGGVQVSQAQQKRGPAALAVLGCVSGCVSGCVAGCVAGRVVYSGRFGRPFSSSSSSAVVAASAGSGVEKRQQDAGM